MNSIIEHPHFKSTRLYTTFREKPLGFIDIGSSGGIHPLILPFAPLTHCTCFEPGKKAYQELKEMYQEKKPFARMTIYDIAVGSKAARRTIYVTKSAVNTSLLKPNEELMSRYNVSGFQLQERSTVHTNSLDNIVFQGRSIIEYPGEFIKMDCQGAEYEILKGAARTLDEQCLALYVEVEFMKMYEKQRTFSELDLFLRKRGFQLYGLYPHYISAKKMNRREGDTEERIVWADAVYFKDPLDFMNSRRQFSQRHIEVLLLVAMLTHYYDFALELADRYFKEAPDSGHIKSLILSLAEHRKKAIEDDLAKLINQCEKEPEKGYLFAKKFVDRNKSNNSLDFIVP